MRFFAAFLALVAAAFAAERPNVLFLHFEVMRRDLSAVCDQVAAFLGHTLTPGEKAAVLAHSAFDYMKDREEYFEMAPPTMFSVREGQFLASGKEKRDEDVTP